MEDQFLIPGESIKRLYEEYKRYGSLVIGFDFDGTVNDYHEQGINYPKMIALLRDLKEIGCELICWTAYKDLKYVSEYLTENKIPFDGINTNERNAPAEK